MQSAEEKLKNMASSAKEHINIAKAKLEEKAEKAAARTPEEKEMAHRHRKAKEAEAMPRWSRTKPRRSTQLTSSLPSIPPWHGHVHEPATRHMTTQPVAGAPGHQTGHQPMGIADPMTGTTVPTYPLGGHPAHSGNTHKCM